MILLINCLLYNRKSTAQILLRVSDVFTSSSSDESKTKRDLLSRHNKLGSRALLGSSYKKIIREKTNDCLE